MNSEVTAGPVPAVAMRSITKRFPGVLANDSVDFEAREGQVHALLGENGAGKSTLASILTGLYRPDAGEIEIYGRRVEFHSPRDAMAAGIAMIHQHFMLIDAMTVVENVMLGWDATGRWLRHTEVAARIRGASSAYGLGLDPGAERLRGLGRPGGTAPPTRRGSSRGPLHAGADELGVERGEQESRIEEDRHY